MINFILLDCSYIGFMWLIIAVIFMFAEIFTPGLFLFIAFSLGGVFAAISAFLNFSFMMQCMIFIVGFIFSFFVLRSFVKLREAEKINTNVNALKGKECVVIKKIEENGKGLVKVDGEVWTAQGFKGQSFPKDVIVKVLFIKGNRLIVN